MRMVDQQPQPAYSQASPNVSQQSQSPTTTLGVRSPGFPTYQLPVTPEQKAREHERIEVILQINKALLNHLNELQQNGLGGVQPQQALALDVPQAKAPSPEYIAYLRCAQATLTYCNTVIKGGAGQPGAQSLPGPTIMNPPSNASPLIMSLYAKLQPLFPGWRGIQGMAGRTAGAGQPSMGQQGAPQMLMPGQGLQTQMGQRMQAQMAQQMQAGQGQQMQGQQHPSLLQMQQMQQGGSAGSPNSG